MQGDAKALLTKGKVVLRSLTGDRGILAAMKSAAITEYLHRWDVAQLLREAKATQVAVLRGEPPIQADA